MPDSRGRLHETTDRTPFRFAGSAYQLFSARQLQCGSYVEVNGPHDTFGAVVRSTQQADGRFLNLVRGIKPRVGQTPVAAL